MNYEPLLALCL